MVKSTPFRVVRKVPNDIKEGDVLEFGDNEQMKVTKIKSIRFFDLRTYEVIGLCKNISD